MSDSEPAAARKRGRPVGGSSAETRARLIDSGRRIFAEQGFDRATIGEITHGAHIGPSAFYRHFPDKESLYEAVFDATLNHVWRLLDDSTRGHESLGAALTSFIRTAERAREGLPYYPEYLSALPFEAARQPRLRRLMTRRTEAQRVTFRSLAQLGRSTGELGDGLSLAELGEHLRVVVMGWLVERNLSVDGPVDLRGLLYLLGLQDDPHHQTTGDDDD